jgi:hypothetical protein
MHLQPPAIGLQSLRVHPVFQWAVFFVLESFRFRIITVMLINNKLYDKIKLYFPLCRKSKKADVTARPTGFIEVKRLEITLRKAGTSSGKT